MTAPSASPTSRIVHENNELMTRVGPGTPMGEVLRRFWTPALLTSELESDGAPVRLRIYGEDLVAFRDSNGEVGIVDAYCPHKAAPLFFGRNEQCGLRCVYHGWKFNVKGECVDIPNIIPPDNYDTLVKRMSIKAYDTAEAGGIVWIYMGPSDKRPGVPHFEWMDLPSDHYYVARWVQRSNWIQGMEGELDSSHISFLHSRINFGESTLGKGGSLATDGAPRMYVKETDYGFYYAARRDYNGKYYWRVTHWMLPSWSSAGPSPDDFFGHGRAWVPIDDYLTTTFSFQYRVDRPLNNKEHEELSSGVVFPPLCKRGTLELPHGHKIDTFLPTQTKENDYKIDRNLQRTESYSGIYGVNTEDRGLQEGMPSIPGDSPGIVDRTREHLVASDAPVIAARRRLVRLAKDLQNGVEPAANLPESYMQRGLAIISPIEDFQEFVAEYENTFEAGALRAAE